MPVSGFLSSFADKAQSAINASPLAAHLPGRSTSPTGPDSQPSNEATQGGYKSHTLDALQYQFRAFGQQYTGAGPVQKIITCEKGVAIDFDSVSRDAKAQSKELYTWGQGEGADIKDVSDRLAYLNFVQGSLASSLAIKLDVARAPLKALRDAETALTPRRNLRTGLQLQLSRLEHEQQRGNNEKKIQELKDQINRAQEEDEGHEKEVEILKRKGVKESERLKWDAVREYGEKLVLLSQAATSVIQALPTIPPSVAQPYAGAQATAAARASLQRALDNYKTGHINLPTPADLNRSDTRSFGETHASELSSISSESVHTEPGIPITPPRPLSPQQQQHQQQQPPSQPSLSVKSDVPPRIDPTALNQATTAIPTSYASPVAPPDVQAPASSPTVAETGVPLSAGAAGPGPASGSLLDIKGASSSAGPRSGGLPGNSSQAPVYGQEGPVFGAGFGAASGGAKYESAEDEKKRLQKEERERVLAGASAAPPVAKSDFESAEDEKKRLQREERERILAGASATPPVAKPDFESAEDEKKRLQREERERLLAPGGAAAAKRANESAEEEKKRLEREERERVLRAGGSQSQGHPEEDLPAYQDY